MVSLNLAALVHWTTQQTAQMSRMCSLDAAELNLLTSCTFYLLHDSKDLKQGLYMQREASLSVKVWQYSTDEGKLVK